MRHIQHLESSSLSEESVRPTLLENCQTSRLAEVSDFPFCKVSTAQIIEPPAHVTQHFTVHSTMDICETHTWSSQPSTETYLKKHQSKTIVFKYIFGNWYLTE